LTVWATLRERTREILGAKPLPLRERWWGRWANGLNPKVLCVDLRGFSYPRGGVSRANLAADQGSWAKLPDRSAYAGRVNRDRPASFSPVFVFRAAGTSPFP
jgi:hypothetical protein